MHHASPTSERVMHLLLRELNMWEIFHWAVLYPQNSCHPSKSSLVDEISNLSSLNQKGVYKNSWIPKTKLAEGTKDLPAPNKSSTTHEHKEDYSIRGAPPCAASAGQLKNVLLHVPPVQVN